MEPRDDEFGVVTPIIPGADEMQSAHQLASENGTLRREIERLNQRVDELDSLTEEYVSVLERVDAWVCHFCRESHPDEPGMYWNHGNALMFDGLDEDDEPVKMCERCADACADIEQELPAPAPRGASRSEP